MGESAHSKTMNLKATENVMRYLNNSRNLAARPRAGFSPALLLLAGWLAVVTPLRADNPPTYWFQIDSIAVPGGFTPDSVALDGSNNVYIADDNTTPAF